VFTVGELQTSIMIKNVDIGQVVTVANYNVQVTLPTPITG